MCLVRCYTYTACANSTEKLSWLVWMTRPLLKNKGLRIRKTKIYQKEFAASLRCRDQGLLAMGLGILLRGGNTAYNYRYQPCTIRVQFKELPQMIVLVPNHKLIYHMEEGFRGLEKMVHVFLGWNRENVSTCISTMRSCAFELCVFYLVFLVSKTCVMRLTPGSMKKTRPSPLRTVGGISPRYRLFREGIRYLYTQALGNGSSTAWWSAGVLYKMYLAQVLMKVLM